MPADGRWGFNLTFKGLICVLLYKLDNSQMTSLSSHLWKLKARLELWTVAWCSTSCIACRIVTVLSDHYRNWNVLPVLSQTSKYKIS
jgi:hypothetical protein